MSNGVSLTLMLKRCLNNKKLNRLVIDSPAYCIAVVRNARHAIFHVVSINVVSNKWFQSRNMHFY